MENQLIHIYLFVCHLYDTHSKTCFQRTSNNDEPRFTDQELLTIWFFAHLSGLSQKKQMHTFIKTYWLPWFPHLPAYQTFVYRLNQLQANLQTCGNVLAALLAPQVAPESDQIIDSLPVMLAQNGHSYRARVAHDLANAGYCAAKKTRFHGVRLHVSAVRRHDRLPLPRQIWLAQGSVHDSKAFKDQAPRLSAVTLFGDLAYCDQELRALVEAQDGHLITPIKKPKGKDLSEPEKGYNRLVRKFRQPIESLFNWIIEKTQIQQASKVRSSEALLVHCWGKLAVVFFLLVFNY